jgi:hypothetical protein
MNRGYSSGLAANRRPTTGLAANRPPMMGLAAGSQPGGGFRSNLAAQNFGGAPAPAAAPMSRPAAPAPAPMMPQMPAMPEMPEAPTAPDFSNMFAPQPLPAPGAAPMMSQPPPSPFAPQPLPFGGFRQEGGPVQPGRAYIVGERGPEMIVPQQPGMVVPNDALRSGSLASRPAVPVGRGMTPERRLEIAQRRAITRGDDRTVNDIARFQSFQGIQQGWQQGRQRAPMMGMPPPMPARGPGARMMPGAEEMMMPAEAMPQQPPLPVDMSNMLPPMPFNPGAALPPSTLMGGTGVPPPPMFQAQQVGSSEVLTQNTPEGVKFLGQRGLPTPPAPMIDMTPVQGTNLRVPTLGGTRVPGMGMFQETPIETLRPEQAGPRRPGTRLQPVDETSARSSRPVTINIDGVPTSMEQNPETGEWRPVRIEGQAGAAGGQPSPGNGTAPFTTPGGVRVNMLPDQASAPTMQTVQMPNEAYANDLTPEQSLEAARAEYLRTGDDTALIQHFKQFPSQAVQLIRQEREVWNQIAQNAEQMATNANLRHRQIQERNAYIDRYSSSPWTQGAIAEEYARNFPQGMTEINRAPVRPNFDLMTQADQLNRQAQQAAGRAAPPAMLPLGPTDPVMPVTRADRYPGGAYDRLMRTTLPVPRVTTRSV